MLREAVRVIMVKDDHLLVMHRNKFSHEYYTLVGGGVDPSESREQALIREVKEETTLDIEDPRLVYIEQAGKPFGIQYIYLCAYPGGEVKLSSDSDEAQINKMGKNLYKSKWLPVSDLPKVPFLSTELKEHLIDDLEHGFASSPLSFSSNAEYETTEQLKRRSNG